MERNDKKGDKKQIKKEDVRKMAILATRSKGTYVLKKEYATTTEKRKLTRGEIVAYKRRAAAFKTNNLAPKNVKQDGR